MSSRSTRSPAAASTAPWRRRSKESAMRSRALQTSRPRLWDCAASAVPVTGNAHCSASCGACTPARAVIVSGGEQADGRERHAGRGKCGGKAARNREREAGDGTETEEGTRLNDDAADVFDHGHGREEKRDVELAEGRDGEAVIALREEEAERVFGRVAGGLEAHCDEQRRCERVAEAQQL